MGSGVWFKSIISKKKMKGNGSHKLKRYSAPENINGLDNKGNLDLSIEDAAAIRIQSAYRAHMGRKTFRRMRGMVRLRNVMQRDSVKKQASTTTSRLHSWSSIQAQIRARRVHMVSEGRLRQKKLENQLKLEAKIHELEAEWSCGSETIDEALAKIHRREEAAVRRERAMAYAFSHQWRANSNPSFGSSNVELSKADWGWSWMDRWVAARPWESRLANKRSPKKTQSRQPNKTAKDKMNLKAGNAGKPSYEGAEEIAAQKVNSKAEEKKTTE